MIGNSVVVGSDKGKVYKIDRISGAVQLTYKAHNKSVTCISFREGFSIVTSSSDGTMHIHYLTPNK